MEENDIPHQIERCKNGDQQAFRLVVEKYQSQVFSLIFRIIHDENDAQDLTQETFIRVWTNIKGYDSQKKFITWVYRIATNLCFDKLKSANYAKKKLTVGFENLTHALLDLETGERKLLNNELGEIIRSLTEQLTPKQKIVFTLKDLEGFEAEEISKITFLSPQKIKSNLFLARKKIREKLELYEPYMVKKNHSEK
ncbi:sigma-70 family RNA polymerase sigma factor [Bacteroidales bacterium OttesenSCG-928-E04]|nr:sigma-70 family RNA polymerase sigma factor [Bacteroidales bacterium OttesenSCG-928-E04]